MKPDSASSQIILSIAAIGREPQPSGAQVCQVGVAQSRIRHVLLSRSGERLDCPSKAQDTVEVFPPPVVAEVEKLNDTYGCVPSMISDELRTDLTIHHMDAISIGAPRIIIE